MKTMGIFHISVFVGLIINGALGQSSSGTYYTCDFIHAFASCDLFITDSYCGTNLVTYANKCEFSKAHCNDPSIDLRHVGDCTDIDTGSGTTVAGNQVILDFFCTALSKQDCPAGDDKVCASDGFTYPNYCEYEKQKCTHRSLTVVSYGDCKI